MAQKTLKITTPVCRLVAGSVYKAKTKDANGNPLTVKSGANKGQPRIEFSFAVAIAKKPNETHWSQNEFLMQIWAFGHAAWPGGEAQNRAFSWKVSDGDSTEPNKKGKKNCDREGHPGNWIIWFSSGTAPRVYNADGSAQIMEDGAIKCGYYVQVFGNIASNMSTESPGIYANHSMVALSAYGPEIVVSDDVGDAGFGQGVALPPGASAVPLTAGIPATGAPLPVTGVYNTPHGAVIGNIAGAVSPPLPGGFAPPPPAPAPIVAAPPPLPVTPNPSILAIPVPPAAPARVMTALAEGRTYEMYMTPGSGWTDALLIQHGLMLP